MTNKLPVVRQVSWPLLLPQIVAIAACILVVYVVLRPREFTPAILIGCALFLVWSVGSRRIITTAHRRGVRLSKQGKFREAIEHHMRSLDFFTTHPWVDKYRSVALMSCSAMSYHEMALLNLAFCYAQVGDAGKSKQYYQAALDAFPDSTMAAAALKMIETFESNTQPGQ